MSQAESIFYKALRMNDGEEMQIVCATEATQKKLFQMLRSEQTKYAREYAGQECDNIIIQKHNPEKGNFTIILLKEKHLFSSVIIKKNDGTEKKLANKDFVSNEIQI